LKQYCHCKSLPHGVDYLARCPKCGLAKFDLSPPSRKSAPTPPRNYLDRVATLKQQILALLDPPSAPDVPIRFRGLPEDQLSGNLDYKQWKRKAEDWYRHKEDEINHERFKLEKELWLISKIGWRSVNRRSRREAQRALQEIELAKRQKSDGVYS
jgi:hypothetical protein